MYFIHLLEPFNSHHETSWVHPYLLCHRQDCQRWKVFAHSFPVHGLLCSVQAYAHFSQQGGEGWEGDTR